MLHIVNDVQRLILDVVLRLVQRFDELHLLEVVLMAFLAFGGVTLLGDIFLSVNVLRITMLVLSSEDNLELRVSVLGKGHKIGFRPWGDERQRCVVAQDKAEPLDVECLGGRIVVEGGVGLVRIELLDLDHFALVAVRDIERSRVEGSVLEYCQNLVLRAELAEVLTALLVVKLLDVSVVPNVLSADCRNALGFQLNSGDRVLGHQIASGSLALDRKGREIIFKLRFLQLRTRTQVYSYRFGLAVVVDGEPEDLGPFLAGGDVVVLVPGDAGDREPFGVGDAAFALAVDDVVYGSAVASVEHSDVKQVFPEEGFVRDFGDAVLAVLAYDDDL